MGNKEKLTRILGISGWSQDHLADLLGVGNAALNRWVRRERKISSEHSEKIDFIYKTLVEPLECEIDRLSDLAEKKLLRSQIKSLDADNCPVEK